MKKPAPQITQDMLTHFQSNINDWKWTDTKNKGMQQAYGNDRRNLTVILNLVKQNKLQEAKDAITDLDTIVRDQIPTNLYNLLFS